MPRLAIRPATAMAIRIRPISHRVSSQAENINPPIEVPKIMARKVVILTRPLPRERSLSGSISGKMPYLAGLKKCGLQRHQEQHPQHRFNSL